MRILLVDDEKNIRHTLRAMLLSWNHEVTAVAGVEEAVTQLNAKPFDFMLTDFKLENRNGIELIREANKITGTPISAVMTAFASFENAVNAIKEGAYDYLPKPFSHAQLEHLLKRVSTLVELKRENERLRQATRAPDFFGGQTSSAMVRLEEFVRKVGPTDESILIVGESGTGKTALANLIHQQSRRSPHPLTTVVASGLSEDPQPLASLIEASRPTVPRGGAGLGTLVIEEIENLPMAAQLKLMQVLSAGGGTQNPRVIATSLGTAALEEAIREGRFREDLYYHLNRFECALVPLRFRREDIPVLIRVFLSGQPLPEAVTRVLLAHAWPGNVRELKNTLERVALLSRGREPKVDDLPDLVKEASKRREGLASGEPLPSLEQLERDHVERVLRIEPNQERAAQILGVTTVTLWRKRKQYGLP